MKIKRRASDRKNDSRKFREAQIRGSMDHTKPQKGAASAGARTGETNGHANGLAAANGLPPLAYAEGREIRLPIDSIRPSATNPRKHFDQAALDRLAESIRSQGIVQPLLVRPAPADDILKLYELVAGERRLKAAKLAGLTHVPCRVMPLADLEAEAAQIVENDQREDLPHLERAAGYQALIDKHGLTVDDVAAKVGKAPRTIRDLLKLLVLPPIARDAVAAGYLDPTTAELIARIPGDTAREDFARRVLTGRTWGDTPTPKQARDAIKNGKTNEGGGEGVMSLRAARELARTRYMIELKAAHFDRKSLDLVPAAGSCVECPKRTGNDPDCGDSRADVCMDPVCFDAKTKAHGDRVLVEAQAAGQAVLPREECKKLFQRDGSLDCSAPYVDLASPCYEGSAHMGQKKWAQVVGKELAAKAVIAVDPKGVVHHLLPKAIAKKAVGSNRTPAQSKEEAKQKDREAAERKKAVIGAEAALRANGKVAEAIVGSFGRPEECVALLQALAAGQASVAWSDACRAVRKRRGLNSVGVKLADVEAIAALAGTLEHPGELLGLIGELVCARKTLDWKSAHFFGEGRGEKGFFEAFGIKRSELMKDLEQEAKAKCGNKKPAKTPGKNGKAKAGPRPAGTEAAQVLDDAGDEEDNPVVAKRLKRMAADLRGEPRGQCRICGCTANDCRGCVERTGVPCEWTSVDADLCSACQPLLDTDMGQMFGAVPDFAGEGVQVTLALAGVTLVGELLEVGTTIPLPKGITKAHGEDLRRIARKWIDGKLKLDLPADMTRDTCLNDLLHGKNIYKQTCALEDAGLITVGDLLDRAAKGDRLVRDGVAYRGDTQLVFATLREVKGLSANAVNEIADAVIDAGLIVGEEVAPA